MSTATTKKITKKEMYTALLAVLDYAEDAGLALSDDITYEGLRGFTNHEIELLDAKTAAAQKRAAQKKADGDELREKVFSVLSTDDFMPIADIVKALDDPDVSAQMVTSRLTQLHKLNRVERDMVPTTTSDGKTKKLSAYRAIQ